MKPEIKESPVDYLDILEDVKEVSSNLIPLRSSPLERIPLDEEDKRLSVSRGPRNKRPCTIANPRTPPGGSDSHPPGKKKPRKRLRSVGSRLKRQAKEGKKFIRKVQRRRVSDKAERDADGGMSCKICFFPDQLLAVRPVYRLSPDIAKFYLMNKLDNYYVRVSEEPNVSNVTGTPGGGKGVFAKVKIPKGTLICPYLGKLRSCRCPPEKKCLYDMKLQKGLYVCAQKPLLDIGYLYGSINCETGEVVKDHTDRHYALMGMTQPSPTPPNYARYVNSLSVSQRSGPFAMEFNCEFEYEGEEVVEIFLVASKDIEEGEELLANYGDEYVIEP
jgi:hypothetical protein